MAKISLGNRAFNFFKETRSELGRTNWPNKEETIRYTWVVIALSAFLVIVLGGLDYFFSYLANKFLL